MKYVKPTYEEYCKASAFARIRYRYGVYIQIFAAILLILLLIYTVTNIEEMKTNPINYAEEKLGVTCLHLEVYQEPTYYNGSIRNITNT